VDPEPKEPKEKIVPKEKIKEPENKKDPNKIYKTKIINGEEKEYSLEDDYPVC
jgi:hypothetical protein